MSSWSPGTTEKEFIFFIGFGFFPPSTNILMNLLYISYLKEERDLKDPQFEFVVLIQRLTSTVAERSFSCHNIASIQFYLQNFFLSA